MDQGQHQKNRATGIHADNDESVGSFSFPSPLQVSQSPCPKPEFGVGMTPKYLINDPSEDTPADVLFHNGHILPHAYHCPSQKGSGSDHSLRSSRNSSINSKESASRSGSNSSSSSGSSGHSAAAGRITRPARPRRVAPPLGSTTELSFRKRNIEGAMKPEYLKKKAEKNETSSWFGGRFFRSFKKACRECHALEPSVKHGVIKERSLKENIEFQ